MLNKSARALLLWALVTVPALAQVPVPTAPELKARAYILLDQDSGQVLAAENENERLDPASITKLMTAYAVFRSLADESISLEDQVMVSEKAWRTPGSRMFIEVDTRVSVEELLQGMIVQSGNDASVALAEHVAGSEDTFAQLMNQLAAELGMEDTNYRNSTGLPSDDHYTSARDISILASAIVREFPEYYAWYSQKEFTYNDITQQNRNRLLWRDPSVDGMKTGFTEAAGYCLVSSAKRDDMRLVSVVMGTRSPAERAKESQSLLSYGFRFYETRLAVAGGSPLEEARVWKGEQETVGVGVRDDIYVTVPRGHGKDLDIQLQLQEPLMAPVDMDQTLGTVTLGNGAGVVGNAPIYALNDVPEGGLWRRGLDTLLLWFE